MYVRLEDQPAVRVISIIDAVLTRRVDGPFGGRIGGSGFAEPIEAPQQVARRSGEILVHGSCWNWWF
jgi:hypothetical protein